MERLGFNDVSNILTLGGTILGTSNIANPFRYAVKSGRRLQFKDVSDDCMQALAEREIDALVSIGGDGTMASAAQFAKKGLTVMGVPKTIDNDLCGTDVTFGFDTAVTTADRGHRQDPHHRQLHHRVMIVEVMGRYAGWIALHAGVAGGADVILIPEIPYELPKICEYVLDRSSRGKRFSIIVAAEGAQGQGRIDGDQSSRQGQPGPHPPGRHRPTSWPTRSASRPRLDCRAVVLGHIQRGGTPTPYDRVLATNFGHTAMELLMKGVKNHLVVLKDGRLSSISLGQVAGRTKTVPRNYELVKAAISVGTSFGT